VTVASAGTIVLRPIGKLPEDDPRLPIAWWHSSLGQAGDASGGTVNFIHILRLGGKRNLELWSCEGAYPQCGATNNLVQVRFQGVELLQGTNEPQIAWAMQNVSFGGGFQGFPFGRDTSVQMYPMQQRSGSNIEVLVRFQTNTNLEAYVSVVWGYLWSEQANERGGAVRPG